MLNYRPEQILIDVEVENSLLAREICDRFSDVPQLILEQGDDHKKTLGLDPGRNPLTQGKKKPTSEIFPGSFIQKLSGFFGRSALLQLFHSGFGRELPF